MQNKPSSFQADRTASLKIEIQPSMNNTYYISLLVIPTLSSICLHWNVLIRVMCVANLFKLMTKQICIHISHIILIHIVNIPI